MVKIEWRKMHAIGRSNIQTGTPTGLRQREISQISACKNAIHSIHPFNYISRPHRNVLRRCAGVQKRCKNKAEMRLDDAHRRRIAWNEKCMQLAQRSVN
jgi:hypothetical protein